MGNIMRFLPLLFTVITVVFLGSSANAATITLSPSSGAYGIGDIFDVSIILDTQTDQITGADVNSLNFDPSILEVVDAEAGTSGTQIGAGTLMTNNALNSTNNTTGDIDFSQVTAGGNTFTGQGTLATITFRALSGGTANVTFDFTLGATNDTNVASGGSDVLTNVTNGSYTILADSNPPVLSNITSSGITANSATISWTTDESATSRVMYGLTTSYGNQSTLDPSLVTSHSVVLSGLSPNTTYNYRVISADSFGNQAQSLNRTFKTQSLPDNTPPNAVADLSASSVDQTSMTLAWIAPSDIPSGGAVSYDIRHSTSQLTESNWASATTVSGEPSPKSPGASESYVLAGLSPGATYYIGIKSADSSGNISDISNVVTQTTDSPPAVTPPPAPPSGGGGGGGGGILNTTQPNPPTDLRIFGGPDQILITWKNPVSSNYVRTTLVRKEGVVPTSVNDGTQIYEGTDEEFTDLNVVFGVDYHYALFTFDRNLNYSNPAKGFSFIGAFNENEISKELASARNKCTPSAGGGISVTRWMVVGSTGEDVKKLQQFLNANGFTISESGVGSPGQETNFYGNLTQAAIRKFQCSQGIVCSGDVSGSGYGAVGPKTRAALTSFTGKSSVSCVPKAPAVSSGGVNIDRWMVVGTTGADVLELQQFLNANGYTIAQSGLGSPGNETSYFGSLTQSAIRRFQCDRGIVCSGTVTSAGYGAVGPKTRAALRGE